VNYYKDNWFELLLIMDFAAVILVQEFTGVIPFMADCGYKPRILFDWKPLKKGINRAERTNCKDACTRAKNMQEVWQWI
jgi:hypothetical protein